MQLIKRGFETVTQDFTENASMFSMAEAVRNGLFTGVIGGRTIFDHKDNGVDYANWTVAGAGTTKGASGIHLVDDNASEEAIIQTQLKPLTQYTLVLNVKDKTLDNIAIPKKAAFPDSVLDEAGVLAPTIGTYRYTFTTSATLTSTPKIKLYCNNNVNGEYIDFEVYAILEGDWTTGELADVEVGKLKYGSNSTFPGGFRMQALGKNLFDISITKLKTILQDTYSAVALDKLPLGSVFGKAYLKNALPSGTTVYFSNTVNPNSTTSEKKILLVSNSVAQGGSSVLGEYLKYITVYNVDNVVEQQVLRNLDYYLDIQLEQGTTATTYEAYKSNESFVALSEPMRSVPAAKDEVRVSADGSVEHGQNVSEDIVLDGSESWLQHSTITDMFYVDNVLAGAKVTNDNILRCAEFASVGYYPETDGISTGGMANPNRIFIRYSAYDNDVAGFKIWLASNNVTLNYQTADETVTELTDVEMVDQDGNPIEYMHIFEGGMFIQEPYLKRTLTYSGGLAWSKPVSGIDKVLDSTGALVAEDTYTLAEDGLSVAIYTDSGKTAEVDDATEYTVYAPVKPEESTVGEVVFTAPIQVVSPGTMLEV